MSTPASHAVIKVGIVGYSPSGWASMVLVPSLLSGPNAHLYRIVAIGSRSSDSASAAVSSLQTVHGLTEIKTYVGSDCSAQLARDPDVDLVVIAVQAMYHADVVKPVIEAGKAYFLEWPCGGDRLLEIVQATRDKRVRSIVGFHWKQSLFYRKMKELVQGGAIGKVLFVNMSHIQPEGNGYWGRELPAHLEYTLKPESGATMLNIVGGHHIPQITELFGNIASVSATAATQWPTYTIVEADGTRSEPRTNTMSDHISFTSETDEGVLLSVSWRVSYTRGSQKLLLWQIDGTEGSIYVESDIATWTHVADPSLYLNGKKVDLAEAYPGEVGGASGSQVRLWTAFARGEQQGYSAVDEGVKVHTILEAITQSATEGRRIDLAT